MGLTPGTGWEPGDRLYTQLAELQPKTEVQRAVNGRALDLAAGLAQTRYRLYTQRESAVPSPLLVVLGLFLAALFAGYGLLAPHHPTVVTGLVV